MAVQPIAKEWAEYCKQVVPKEAGYNQVKETKRAFFSGANALFHVIIKRLEPGQDATEADLKFMDSVDAELKQFLKDITEGRQ